MERDEKLKAVDDELVSFYQYCEKAGFTASEMNEICAPLTSALHERTVRRRVKAVGMAAVLLLCVYAASQTTLVSPHVSAIGRILMIKLLPVWDWTTMFYESCLIANPLYQGTSLGTEDCMACEALDRIDRASDVSFKDLLDGYLSRDSPVIVVDAMSAWSVATTDHFYFENITETYLTNDKLTDTVPCVLVSNIRPGSNDLLSFLKRIQSPRADKWFVHWQNCDINAVKALRKFYQRPYFLSSSVAPAHFNWVLMSSDYNAKTYKKVELDTGLIMLAQLRGSTSFRLAPHSPCNVTCQPLTGDLKEGEILVLTNYLWSFEYLPGKHTDNVAILTESIWDDTIML